jgi:hypothetical protein
MVPRRQVGKMVVKMLFVVAVAVALLVVADRQDVVHKWGVVGSCEVVRSPVGDENEWRACKEGLFTGYPSLVGDCNFQSQTRGYQYWRCSRPGS